MGDEREKQSREACLEREMRGEAFQQVCRPHRREDVREER